MWADNETDRDFLNFRYVADLASEMIIQAKGRPLSLGVSGSWGVGKSSMVKLLETSLRGTGRDDFVFITFNAWLYQGLDDARAALLEVIAQKLAARAKDNESVAKKVTEFAKRIDYVRVSRMGVDLLSTIMTGVPVGSIIKGITDVVGSLSDGDISTEDVDQARKVGAELGSELKGSLREKKAESPPQAIQKLRDSFEEILAELNVTLVVFVDDLDRCLPDTAIRTLEAMRLFLFMQRTAFVIAADDKMIREAVRIHFKDANLDEDLITSYFDKLIQVPLRVPPLGINEVRAYLMLLFVERADLTREVKDKVRVEVCKLLGQSWRGEAITPTAVRALVPSCPEALGHEIELSDRLARLMTISKQIRGNPRLIKRFLNTLSIRKALAAKQQIVVDESVLAKVLLLERSGTPSAFTDFVEMINATLNGTSDRLAAIERAAREGDPLPRETPGSWQADEDFITEWLSLDPPLGGQDLRGALHVGRESVPLIAATERLSKEAAAALRSLMALRVDPQRTLLQQVRALSASDRDTIMGRLIGSAATETQWGTPNILRGMLAVAECDAEQAKRLAGFFKGLSASSITAAIVPRLANKTWADEVLDAWKAGPDINVRVKRAIEAARVRGD